MSSVRRLGVEFYGNASGFISASNRVFYGTNRVAQGFRSAARDSNLLSNQVKAMGTTMRYAFAGQVVFGVVAALGRLKDFEVQLGTINSLAGQIDRQGKLRGIGSTLDDLGSDAILTANKFGVATTDIETYMERFYSSFQPGNRSKQAMKGLADQWASTIAGLQAILGTEAGDPSELGGGIAGFIAAIPGGKNNLGQSMSRIANLIAYITSATPNIKGTDISRDIGRMGSVMKLARLSPEELFALWGTAAEKGGSASVIGRGITQLAGASIMHPKSPEQLAAFGQAGLPTDPNQLRKLGGFAVIEKLLTHAANGPGNKPDVSFLFNAFGRQESVRQFVNLLGKEGPDALKRFLKGLQQAEKQNLYQQRVDLAMQRRGLAQLSESFQNIGLSLVRGLEGPLGAVGVGVKFLSDELAKHRTLTKAAVGVGVTLASSRALAKLGAFNGANRWLGRAESQAGAAGLTGRMKWAGRGLKLLSGMSAAERAAASAALMTEEAPAVLAGGAADGSRANPYWVIISPWSWSVGSPGGDNPFSQTNPNNPGGTKLPPVIAGGKFGRFVKGGLLAAGTVIGADLAWKYGNKVGNYLNGGGHPYLDPKNMTPAQRAKWNAGQWVDIPHKKSGALDFAMRRAVQLPHSIRIHGAVDVTTKMTDKNGQVVAIGKAQAPVQLWGPNVFSSAGGKPGSRKANT